MGKIALSVLLLLGLVLCPASSRADTIYLKSGNVVTGEIVSETDHVVSVERRVGSSGTIASPYPKSEIERIERGPVEHIQQKKQTSARKLTGGTGRVGLSGAASQSEKARFLRNVKDRMLKVQQEIKQSSSSSNHSAASQRPSASTSIPHDVLSRIKNDVAQDWPGSYSLQKTLVDAHVKSWKKMQRNYTGIPDRVFFEIRDRLAEQWPNQYSLQETLLEAEAKGWKELHR